MTNKVQIIIDAFGGIRPMARLLGKPHTTISNWTSRGYIPFNNYGEIWEKAKSEKVGISKDTLLEACRPAN